ncbi:Cu-transporting P-type ATPase [Salix suchowensis]|nr:Cu-transporting P-type ATPase [Salix suchowensis]
MSVWDRACCANCLVGRFWPRGKVRYPRARWWRSIPRNGPSGSRVFDKTGTLTQGGEPKVSDAHILPAAETRWSRETILGFASELESAAPTPRLAIRAYCKAAVARTMTAEDFDEVSGRGMKAHFPSMKCTAIIGNEAWMEAHEAAIDVGVSQQFGAWRSEAKSVVLMALREEGTSVPGFHLVAILQSRIHSEKKRRRSYRGFKPKAYKHGSFRAIMLRQRQRWRMQWASPLAMSSLVFCPTKKRRSKRQPSTLRRFYSKPRLNQRCIVAMVGDGINDAPFWAFIYNAAAIPIAAGVVYPAGHTRLDPVWASLAMALSRTCLRFPVITRGEPTESKEPGITRGSTNEVEFGRGARRRYSVNDYGCMFRSTLHVYIETESSVLTRIENATHIQQASHYVIELRFCTR